MGGYGAFIWPAYAIAFTILMGLLAVSLRSLGSSEKALRALEESGEDASGETQA